MSDIPTTVPHSRRTRRVASALLMGSILVGCAAPGGPGLSKYEPTYLRLTEERIFAQALRRNYLELATNAYDHGALDHSDFYSLRALMAAEGKLAQPADHGRHALAGVGDGEAAAAGQRLSMLLMTGARLQSPAMAARAQAAYDCWLVESGPLGNPQIAQSCRFNALNTLAQLEVAGSQTQIVYAGGDVAPQPQTYVVDSGQPSQTIAAPGGYRIEITTTHGGGYVPQHFVQGHVPATYSTVQRAPTYVEAVPIPYQAPYSEMTSPYTVETAPIAVETVTAFAPIPVQTVDYAMAEMAMVQPTTVVALEAPARMVPEQSAYAPMDNQGYTAPIIDLGPLPVASAAVPSATYAPSPMQYGPVYSETVEPMPLIEMAALPVTQDTSAADALMSVQASIQSDFAVFFGFDSDAVTLEAEDVLIDTVERVKLSGATKVMLMGFTDSVGDARYNQLLAMRRAQAVRQYLQRQLGSGVTFEILPVGEIAAVKNGGDGVKEALNRKVEISLQ